MLFLRAAAVPSLRRFDPPFSEVHQRSNPLVAGDQPDGRCCYVAWMVLPSAMSGASFSLSSIVRRTS
jgi:hypothetical protein